MKNIIFMLSFLLVSIGYAQDRNNNESEKQNYENEPNYYEVVDTTSYTLDKQQYIFSPTENGVNVKRVDEEDGEIDLGDLRRTTTDGFYIMTSTPENQSSFGRFDSEGNFRSYRYDPESDSVIEENFEIQDPVERRDQNRRDKRGRKDNRSNNSNNRNN
ncbi:hypothetical protein GCM10007103_11730 [Salinimicrobium marinum]|uniref:YD repeat-containing protein n=1 Tax=Salinimicrobium marinum TaxID=680283 RepID=A0A918SCE2_9FLAO|nr:hypothetical protein [Salinimicrobium marinum]GHA31739.1 hypothetical protein GCM10007103_11730 [Salinimicrobium marinum]